MSNDKETKKKNPKNHISTSRLLELLHTVVFRSSRTCSLGEKTYTLVVVDDLTRFSWVAFLATKDEALESFPKLCKKIHNEKGLHSFKD